MQGAVGFYVSIYLQIYRGISQWIFQSVKIWQMYGHESVVPRFLAQPCKKTKWELVDDFLIYSRTLVQWLTINYKVQ